MAAASAQRFIPERSAAQSRKAKDTAALRKASAVKVAAPRLDPKLTHRIICDAGQWAKGETESEARKAFKQQHSSRRIPNAIVYAVTPGAYINDMGYLVRPVGDPAPVNLAD